MRIQSKAARKAAALLSKHQIKTAPVDVTAIAKREGLSIVFRDFDSDVSGLFVQEGAQSIIGVNGRDPETRQRFTIAHELGHYSLHAHERELFVDKSHFVVYRRDGTSEKGIDSKEIEANQFAAELLMPMELIADALKQSQVRVDDDLALRKLAHHFNVSAMAMAVRLSTLDLIVAG